HCSVRPTALALSCRAASAAKCRWSRRLWRRANRVQRGLVSCSGFIGTPSRASAVLLSSRGWDVHPGATNLQHEACEALQLAFELPGALGSQRTLRESRITGPYIAFAAAELARPSATVTQAGGPDERTRDLRRIRRHRLGTSQARRVFAVRGQQPCRASRSAAYARG